MINEEEEEDITINIMTLGNSSVGKTSYIIKYTDNYFSETSVATIGVEFKEHEINFKNKKIKLQIWDTSGQERFRSITETFYRGADGVLFVFDVTNKDSFDNMKMWLMDDHIVNLDAKKILVGNKIDLVDQRVVNKESMDKYLQSKNMNSFETSAKTGENVGQIFEEITELILANKSEEEIIQLYSKNKNNLNISSDSSGKKGKNKKCC